MATTTKTRPATRAKKQTAKKTTKRAGKRPAARTAKKATKRAAAKKAPVRKPTARKAASTRPSTTDVRDIPLGLIDPDPNNRPIELDDAFTDSVRQLGVLAPILVTPGDVDGRYNLVAGHRRYGAARKARQKSIPAVVRTLSENERVVAQAVENLQRSDLGPLEEAKLLGRLDGAGVSRRDIARQVGRSFAWVNQRLALLSLPDPMVDAVADGRIHLAELPALAKVATKPEILDQVIAEVPAKGQSRPRWWGTTQVAGIVDKAVAEDKAARARQQVEDELTAKGLTVVPWDGYYTTKYKQLASHELDLPVRKHAKEPCHAVTIPRSNGTAEPVPVCTDPKRHRPDGASTLKAATLSREADAAKARERQRKRAEKDAERRAERAGELATVLAKRPNQKQLTDVLARSVLQLASLQDDLDDICGLLGVELPAPKATNPYTHHQEVLAALTKWMSGGADRPARAALAAVAATTDPGLVGHTLDDDFGLSDAYKQWAAGAGAPVPKTRR